MRVVDFDAVVCPAAVWALLIGIGRLAAGLDEFSVSRVNLRKGQACQRDLFCESFAMLVSLV